MSNNKKICIITLGCLKNQDDTRQLAGYLSRKGFEIEENFNKAHAIVVHTCSFIEDAKKESLETILRLTREKKPSAKLFVTGCLVQQHGKELLKEFPEIDAFLGTGQLEKIPQFMNDSHAGEKPNVHRKNPGGFFDPDGLLISSNGSKTGFLRISEGCSHLCSFCVIPHLRGPLRSRSERELLEEARRLYEAGTRELLVIGQDTGVWGRDIFGETRLPNLLEKFREMNFKWIRLMYMHPQSMTDETLRVLAESPDIFPYLDMPLQHIDDTILRQMKRRLFEKDTRILVEKIRRAVPDISFRTTFLLGFPGEKEKQFQKLIDFVKEGHFDYLGSFAYSKEEHTPAGKMEGQIARKIKERRQKILAEAQYEVALEKSRKRLDKKELFLAEEKEGKFVFGRTAREAPEIDAVVKIPSGKIKLNEFTEVQLTSFDAYVFSARRRRRGQVAT